METYVLKPKNGRPLKFSGDFLGSSMEASSEGEIAKAVLEKKVNTHLDDFIARLLKINLYRTSSGKIIQELLRCSIDHSHLDVASPEELLRIEREVEIFDDVISFFEKAQNAGRVTEELIDNVLENHPEFEEHWYVFPDNV